MKKLLLLCVLLFSGIFVLSGCSSNMVSDADLSKMDYPGYMVYTPELVQSALEEGKKVALYFFSPNCDACVTLDADIRKSTTADPLPDVSIFRVDRESNQDVAQEYNVDIYNTIVYLWEDTKSVTWLTTWDMLVSEFRKPASVKIMPKQVITE